ncbi:MAG TPA: adenine deaminase [Phaeodactylibacter sp.]|nr:adenine deaminase [Phaeodactylibacter sp.]
MKVLHVNVVDVHRRCIYPATVVLAGGRIASIEEEYGPFEHYLLPGLIDAHVHIESSMLVPSEFARMAVVHGTVATVSDPHEIGNVLGEEGVRYMIENGKKVPFHFFFGAPSCVPATVFETAGAVIDARGVAELLAMPEIRYLAEMMNYPGVLHGDQEVMAKLEAAKKAGKPIDGHAPGLRGEDARRYFAAGITTDHECFSLEEGREKAELGVQILIREGSAAKNFEALIPLLASHPEQVMFCSDDKHPDDLMEGHINQLLARAVAAGYDLFDALRACTVNPVRHYGLPTGLLREGDSADLVVVKDLETFEVLETYVRGTLTAQNGKTLIASVPAVATPNKFNASALKASDFSVKATGTKMNVIEAYEGELITGKFAAKPLVKDGMAMADPERDILKIAVVNRYEKSKPAVAFIRGFGLKEGALASCVAHDSHNIVVVGVDDADMAEAVNAIVKNRGGISASAAGETRVLPLPVAGIMSADDGYKVAQDYAEIDSFTKNRMGCRLDAPFMTLSFMALLVIPSLKLSDKGLFDGEKFAFAELFTDP